MSPIVERLIARGRAEAAARIRERRDALAAQRQQAIEQLTLLQRNIDAMSGGVQELDAALEMLEA